MDKILNISEIFLSIQGESSYAGFPCGFIRFSGCNLNCSWCDSLYANSEGKQFSVDEVFNQIEKYNIRLVEITGGEPLLQADGLYHLSEILLRSGYKILLETNGTLSLKNIDKNIHIIMDIKTPSSNANSSFLFENLNYLKPTDEIKFIIQDKIDFSWALSLIKAHNLLNKFNILFSPVFNKLPSKNLSSWIIHSKLYSARLNLQLHKYIWGPDKKGV